MATSTSDILAKLRLIESSSDALSSNNVQHSSVAEPEKFDYPAPPSKKLDFASKLEACLNLNPSLTAKPKS